MPLYGYFCYDHKGGCGHKFEEQLSVDERMKPMNAPCPKCKKENTICREYKSNLAPSMIINPKDKMDESFKETMTRIHKEHKISSSWF